MDRINKLTKQEVTKELKAYNPYIHLSQNKISKKFDNVESARKELYNLEQTKYPKMIEIKGKSYTEDELFDMIQYYITQHRSVELNEDTLRLIMLNSNFDSLQNICLTNKLANKICNTVDFWKEKFILDELPLPISSKDYNKLDKKYRSKRMHSLKNVHDWITAYKQMYVNYQLVLKLINHINKTDIFSILTFHDLLNRKEYFIVNLIIPNTINKNDNYSISYDIDIIIFIIHLYDEDENEEKDIFITKEQYISILTYLFYYYGEDNFNLYDFNEEIELSFNDLTKSTKKIKKVFPFW
ncbi:MAG TPA: hypothetical protein VLG50_06565 [Candidatus Saccharimonadales bacterium]|nr:hypothetical protein [Candidatus Saccharimonadales bacterium]